MIFYRFRPTNRLLNGNQELLKQSIFFAHPESLNDPMEGYRDIYWKGDEIVWKNLFRHYILCLERTCLLALLCNESENLTAKDIPIHISMDDFPTPEAKQYCLEIIEEFLNNKYILQLIEAILTRTSPIRRDELAFYLGSAHPLAIELILEKYEEIKITPPRPQKEHSPDATIKKLIKTNLIEIIEQSIKENDNNTDITEHFFSSQKNLKLQINLLHHYNNQSYKNSANKKLIIQEFPETYSSLLEELIYPEWYTACFMSSCENSSVWGHYGDNHKGVCLIFESEQEKENNLIPLTGINGWGSNGPSRGTIRFKFEPINYEEGFGEIDFFRSLGRLPRPTINSTWHTLNGKLSICAEHMTNSEDDWRSLYWQQFYRDIKVKSPDWRYENEYRLILCDMMNSHSAVEDRVLTYEFSSLKGIIFGINTSTEDKIEIMRIVDEKCASNIIDDFKFYQAYYSAQHKCIKHTELSLIKYSPKTK